MTPFAEVLIRETDGLYAFGAHQLDALERHYQLLVRWNKAFNLTRITNLQEAVRRHYCESVFVATQLPPGDLRIVDIGSGAGFPGFPIAVCRPESHVTLVESHAKKCVFLWEACGKQRNVTVECVRGEELKPFSFDWVVSRAVLQREILACHAAPNVALLSRYGEDAPGWRRIELPWPNQGFVRLGQDNVPRGTSSEM